MVRGVSTGVWLLLAACAGGGGTDADTDSDPVDYGERGACDPLVDSVCSMPFPSDFYLADDPTAATGKRVAFLPETFPENLDGEQMTVSFFNERDGFSINSAMFVDLGELDDAPLVKPDDIGASLEEGSPTVLIDTTTGEKVPHWAELDARGPDDQVPLLTLRAAVPLDWDHTYVVGLAQLQRPDGTDIPTPAGFAALRDGTDTDDNDLLRQAARFEEVVFPALEGVGWDREATMLAWSFSTASRSNTLGDMEHIVADVLSDVPAEGPDFVITETEPGDCGTGKIALTLEGTFEAPLYTEADVPGTLLHRGEDGLPARNGTTDVGFIVRVPCSVAEGMDGKGPVSGVPLIQYGHGLLGNKDEVRAGHLADLANLYGLVLVGINWKGFASPDVLAIVASLPKDPGSFAFVPQRSMQGMAEQHLLYRLAAGALADAPELSFDGVKVLEGSDVHYYGISQGGIMGAAYVAMSPDVDRGVLGVTGGPYSLLLPRSVDFDSYFDLFTANYATHEDVMIIVLGLLQQLWDPVEPSGWMHDLGPDSGKAVLMQVAISDAQVTTLGAHLMARAYGARSVAPAVRPIWGVEEATAPFTGSALVEWHYTDVDPEPLEAHPPAKSEDTHECPRRMPEARDQLIDFLLDGEVRQYCDGPCETLRSDGC